MIDERDALYRAVCANAGDEVPRLVFADWLQEHGEESCAEFIRLQCRLAGMNPNDPEYVDLKLREKILFDAHKASWLEEVLKCRFEVMWEPELMQPTRLGFDRGFPSWAIMDIEDEFYDRDEGDPDDPRPVLLNHVRRVLSETPCREFDLFVWDEVAPLSLFEAPDWEAVTGLALEVDYANSGADEAAIFARSGLYRNLRKLYHSSTSIGDVGLANFANADLPNLRELMVFLDTGTPAGMRRFVRSKLPSQLGMFHPWGPVVNSETITELTNGAWPNLHTLRFPCRHGDTSAVEAVASSGAFPCLTSLVLEGGTMNKDAMKALGESKHFRLTELDLSESRLLLRAADSLARCDGFSRLRKLHVSADRFNDKAANTLATSPNLRELTWLTISNVNFGTPGFQAIFASPAWERLASLTLSTGYQSPGVKAATLQPALAALELPALRHLDLTMLPVGVRAARSLANRPCLAGLRSLNLDYCKLGDNGAAALFASPYFNELEYLNLNSNNIKAGIDALADPSVMPNLKGCSLAGNPLKPALKRKLKKRPGVVL